MRKSRKRCARRSSSFSAVNGIHILYTISSSRKHPLGVWNTMCFLAVSKGGGRGELIKKGQFTFAEQIGVFSSGARDGKMLSTKEKKKLKTI